MAPDALKVVGLDDESAYLELLSAASPFMSCADMTVAGNYAVIARLSLTYPFYEH